MVPTDGPRTRVLKLHGTRAILWGTGQGVRADSMPVPYEFGATYRLTVYGRTDGGPNCRIYVEGYQWKPGVKPHGIPSSTSCARSISRGPAASSIRRHEERAFQHPLQDVVQGRVHLPRENLSPDALAHLKKVEFLLVHMLAIDGWDGDIFLDDVVLEKPRPPSPAKGESR